MLKYQWQLIPQLRLWQWTFATYPPTPSQVFSDAKFLNNHQRIHLTSFSWAERFEFEEVAAMLMYFGTPEVFAANAAFQTVWHSRDRALGHQGSVKFSRPYATATLEYVGTI